MKKTFTLIILFVLLISDYSFASANYPLPASIKLEMFLMRKGKDLTIALDYSGTELPEEIVIERKSTAPLSQYRKIIIMDNVQISQFKDKNKMILKDDYPESRQLDAFYRLRYTTTDGVVRTLPAVFLARSSDEAVTFGDHEKDESIFVEKVSDSSTWHEKYDIRLDVSREGISVAILVDATNQNVEGEWTIERKSSKPLASFRRVKTILDEDLEAVKKGPHQIFDIYPESRQLDAYYRLVITDKEGNRIEFPMVYLKAD